MSDNEKNYNFQIVRGGACLFIVLNHCALCNNFTFGECGVDIFLVLSGMLTAMNAAKHEHLRRTYFFDKIRKLLPLYWCATLFVFVVGMLMPQLFSTMQFSIENLLYSLFLIPGHTYFIYPGWTLTYFFLFYLIYFVSDKVSKNRDLCASITIVCITVVGVIFRLSMGNNLITSYFNPIILEFAYGIGLFHLLKKISIKSEYRYVTYIVSLILFFDYKEYLWPRYIVPALLACVAIACFANADIKTDSRAACFLSKVGDISFVIYILHPLIIRPIDKILVKLIGDCFNPIYIIGVLLGVGICVVVCWFINPLLKKMRVV